MAQNNQYYKSINLAHWKDTPAFSDRLATANDVRQGKAIFATQGANREVYKIKLPCCAILRNKETGERLPVIVVQAETVKDNITVGIKHLSGEPFVCLFSELELLEEPNEIFFMEQEMKNRNWFSNLLRRKQFSNWEELFSPVELDTFFSLVNGHFINQGKKYSVQDGFVILDGANEKIDLRNIAQTCRHAGKNKWKDIITGHLSQLENSKEQSFNFDPVNRLFAEVMPLLAIRLWPEGTLKNAGETNLVYRKDLDGTISTLVINLPETILSVPPKAISKWGKSQDELLEIGYQNTFSKYPPIANPVVLAGIVNAIILSGDMYLTATHILNIPSRPEYIGKYGTLMGVPLRDGVTVYPINETHLTRPLNLLARICNDVFHQGPGSVSPYLYWYYDGKFTKLRFNEREQKLYLPPELMKIVEQ